MKITVGGLDLLQNFVRDNLCGVSGKKVTEKQNDEKYKQITGSFFNGFSKAFQKSLTMPDTAVIYPTITFIRGKEKADSDAPESYSMHYLKEVESTLKLIREEALSSLFVVSLWKVKFISPDVTVKKPEKTSWFAMIARPDTKTGATIFEYLYHPNLDSDTFGSIVVSFTYLSEPASEDAMPAIAELEVGQKYPLAWLSLAIQLTINSGLPFTQVANFINAHSEAGQHRMISNWLCLLPH